jgi:hypothetical protein
MTGMGHKLRRGLLGGLAGLSVLVLLFYAAVIRPRSWDATAEEAARFLPGDDLVAAPIGVLTHAITIRRPPREVWPWLVQMGAGRAGWYSYDFIDNGRQSSLGYIEPELQQIEVGSIMPAMPGMTEGFTVLRIEPELALILGWLSPAGDPITTWAFVLEEPEPGYTRLLVRNRASSEYRPPFGLPGLATRTLVPWGHAIMERKQLRGIRERVERHAPSERIPRTR